MEDTNDQESGKKGTNFNPHTTERGAGALELKGSDENQGAGHPLLLTQNDMVTGKRSVKHTEKYLAHIIPEKRNAFKKTKTEILYLIDESYKMIDDEYVDPEVCRKQRHKVKEKRDSLLSKAEELRNLDASLEMETDCEFISQSLVDVITKLTLIIGNETDRFTSVSQRTRSSKRSSSSISSKRAAAAAEVAALETQAQRKQIEAEAQKQIEKRENELKRELAELKHRFEQTKLESEIAIQKAKIKVYDSEEKDFDDYNEADQKYKISHSQREYVKLNPHAETFFPPNRIDNFDKQSVHRSRTPFRSTHLNRRDTSQKSSCSSCSSNECLAQAIRASRVPLAEPPIFTGNPLEYQDWERAFSMLIENDVPPNEKIHHLKKYLGGTAKEAVSGLFFLNSEDAYRRAREVLKCRFGDPLTISTSFKSKLYSWRRIGDEDNKNFQRYADFLSHCQMAMTEVPGLGHLDSIEEISKMAEKLPKDAFNRWNRITSGYRHQHSRYPTFTEFVNFVTKEAAYANDPYITVSKAKRISASSPRRPLLPNPDNERKSTFATGINDTTKVQTAAQAQAITCRWCRMNHDISSCRQFGAKPISERRQFVRSEKLCFSCLKENHLSSSCTDKKTCRLCQKTHPTSMHINTDISSLQNKGGETGSVYTGTAHTNQANKRDLTSMIIPVFVSAAENPDQEVLVYALIDTMSDTSFITKDTADRLHLNAEEVSLHLTTLSGTSAFKCNKYKGLQVKGFLSGQCVNLAAAFERSELPIDQSHIPTSETAAQWPHLAEVRDKICPKLSCPIGLLIGYDCPQAFMPLKYIPGNPGEPFAQQTPLGWSIIGGSRVNPQLFDTFGESYFSTVGSCHVAHVYRTSVKEVSPSEILNAMERDCSDNNQTSSLPMSQEDLTFLDILSQGIKQRADGFYEMPLPMRRQPTELPNNRIVAFKRAMALKSQFKRKPEYFKHYCEFMSGILNRGEAERVPISEREAESAWYLPHHGVYHPRKKDKVRVVFDCSARFMGVCINDLLLQGPDLINSLVGVLLRFRVGSVAFSCDIKGMYHQFRVAECHQDLLRFLWWEDGDLSKNPIDYRMKVHIFGASSSPGCANFCLKKIADDFRHLSPHASDFLKNNFYVDDGLQSEDNVDDAKKTVESAQQICKKANLELHKLISNKSEICMTTDNAEDNIENTLGVLWCTSSDTLVFKFEQTDRPETRRGLLATVASVYDPLGLISPITLTGKNILQELCRQGFGWDSPLSDSLCIKWKAWLKEMNLIHSVSVPRCYLPEDFGKVVKIEVHHFSDASTEGFGQCSYLRQKNDKGNVHCALVYAKSRVAPVKSLSIPRLELQAAVLSARAANLLKRELDSNAEHFFWVDSKIALGYIKNESKRFHLFVTNRVQKIHEASNPCQWHYVQTNNNPADHASRGLNVNQMISSSWFTGPKFLWEDEIVFEGDDWEVPEDDKEVKHAFVHFSSTQSTFESISKKFSSFNRLITAISVLVRCAARKRKITYSKLDLRTMSENKLIKAVQGESFQNGFQLTKTFKELCPFQDGEGVWRVGGRLNSSEEAYGIRHPIIVLKSSHLSHLIAVRAHEKVAHQGRNSTMNEIRSEGFWLVGARAVVSSVINKCTKCKRMRGQLQRQQMAPLPMVRQISSPPFSHCGIDVFGPFFVKEGRREMKRYGLLITCLSLRAVHIEVLRDMSADSFMNAFRCLIAVRGAVRSIYCDQGTNFIGAKNELDRNLQGKLTELGCEFHFNPPTASHFGGVWERLIRTVRAVLEGLVPSSKGQLDEGSLRTFFYEAAAIINSRPLTVENLERVDGPLPLSPNHLLTGKGSLIAPPPGTFPREDLYLKKQWRRVQHLAEVFWGRWRREYLSSLQKRQVWQNKEPNISSGDIVILQDEGSRRCHWQLARVTEVMPSGDGLVRSVKLLLATSQLDEKGKPRSKRTFLVRPIHKMVVLIKSGSVGAAV